MTICRIDQIFLMMLLLGMSVIFPLSFTGCRRAENVKHPSAADTKRVLDRFDRLCDIYKHAGLDEARRSQEEAVRLVENSSLEPRVRAHAMFFAYSRLYVLETAAHNQAAAHVDLLKARYWNAREDELNGDPVDQVAAHDKLFTPNICFHIARVFGAASDRNKDPAFMTRKAPTTLPTQESPG